MSLFGEKLRTLRNERKLSQRFLAEKLGVSKASITMWEINQREPSFDTATKLADFFDVSLDYLLGRTDIRDGHIIKTPTELVGEGGVSVEKSGSEELTSQEIEAIRRMLADQNR